SCGARQRQGAEAKTWSRGRDLNPRPADYESAALPLSYLGLERVSHSITALCGSSVHMPLIARWKVVGSFAEFGFEDVHCAHLRVGYAFDVDVDRQSYVAVAQDRLNCFVVHA